VSTSPSPDSVVLIRQALDDYFHDRLRKVADLAAEHHRGAGDDDTTADRAARAVLWSDLTDLGVLRYELPVGLGGMELGLRAAVAVAERLGRHDCGEPYLGTTFALDLLAAGGDPGRQWRERLAREGAAVAVAARSDGSGPYAAGPDALELQDHAPGRTGVVALRCFVHAPATCRELLLVGTHDGREVAVLVPRDDPGVSVRRHDDLGQGDLHTVVALGARVSDDRLVLLAEDGFATALRRARVRQAAYLLGLARGAVEVALGHVSRRSQFGRSLLDFQATGFLLAEQRMRIEAGLALVDEAVAAFPPVGSAAGDRAGDDDRGVGAVRCATPDAAVLAAEALVLASETAVRATRQAMHLHGAAGFREDRAGQRYYRRAVVASVRFGTLSELRREISDLLTRLDHLFPPTVCPALAEPTGNGPPRC
jgi:alkylation response protein AidB-like acyl-CoA dehydrogenase